VVFAVSCKSNTPSGNEQAGTPTPTGTITGTCTAMPTFTVTQTGTRTIVTMVFQDGVLPSTAYAGTSMNMMSGSYPSDIMPPGTYITVGPYNSDNYNRRGLIKMDVSLIPSGAVVVASVLRLTVYSNLAGTNSVLYGYKLTNDWVSGQVNFNQRSTGQNWGTAGGDFDAGLATMGTAVFEDDLYTDVEINTKVTQAWLTSASTNYGLILRVADEASGSHYLQYWTGLYATPASRPRLTIQYYIP
jgi:hypothetical protein